MQEIALGAARGRRALIMFILGSTAPDLESRAYSLGPGLIPVYQKVWREWGVWDSYDYAGHGCLKFCSVSAISSFR